MQAVQEMHRLRSVIRPFSSGIAPVGQTDAAGAALNTGRSRAGVHGYIGQLAVGMVAGNGEFPQILRPGSQTDLLSS